MPLKVKLASPRGSATRGSGKLISCIGFGLTPETARGIGLGLAPETARGVGLGLTPKSAVPLGIGPKGTQEIDPSKIWPIGLTEVELGVR